MATQEERLTAVENDLRKFKVETVKAHHDLVADLAMVRGLAITSVERIANMRDQIEDFKLAVMDRLDRQDHHFDAQEAHFEMHQKRLDSLERTMDSRFAAVDQRFDAIDRRFDRLEKLLLDRLPPA